MTQLEADFPREAGQRTPKRWPATRVLTVALTLLAIVVLAGFVAVEGVAFYRELRLLQVEVGDARQSAVVGYQNIAPITSFARAPEEWHRDDGDSILLWSRWQDGVGHKWFRFVQGQLDIERMVRPTPEYICRAIDYPMVETNGGAIWQRIPPEAPVVGHTLEGQPCAYPIAVLGKVQVINDIVREHPFLVVVNLFPTVKRSVSIFDASRRDGRRLTMAPSGYFHDRKPVLYDRGTESFWVEDADCLKAIAGAHRGESYTRVAYLQPVTWGSWLSQNRDSRLLVGADRSQGVPAE